MFFATIINNVCQQRLVIRRAFNKILARDEKRSPASVKNSAAN